MLLCSSTGFLIGLVLLALQCDVPGIILVILTLADADKEINKWLLEKLQLTHYQPGAVGRLAAPLDAAHLLVVLYFLKLKLQKPLHVPSTFLSEKERRGFARQQPAAMAAKKQHSSIAAQLLVMLFLIYAVLRLCAYHGSTMESRHYILLIDNSASMSVTDVLPNRLEWAKREALKEIDAARSDDLGMVIVFNSKATTLQSYTNDRLQG